MKSKTSKNKNSNNNVAFKLLPWIVSIVIYFSSYPNSNSRNYIYVIVKLFPMLSLCLFVYLVGGCSRYSKRILYGLVFSAIGDGLLVFKE